MGQQNYERAIERALARGRHRAIVMTPLGDEQSAEREVEAAFETPYGVQITLRGSAHRVRNYANFIGSVQVGGWATR